MQTNREKDQKLNLSYSLSFTDRDTYIILNYRVAELLKIGKKIKNKVQNKLEDFLSFPKCAKIAGKNQQKKF